MTMVGHAVARERFRRTLMATRARTNYKFRDPDRIQAKYSKPSKVDRGQPVAPSASREEVRKKVFAK